jgi:exosortase
MRYAKLAITLILFMLLYLPVFGPLVKEWIDVEDYSHGFLIPLISLYFLWHKKDELKKVPVMPSATGVVFILAGLALYLAARVGYQFFLQCLSMLVVLFGIVYAYAGSRMAKKAAFPIAYLILMIPLPQLVYTTITFHLRLLSTKMAYFIIGLLGISASRDGNIINLSTCSLVVANPCSGLRGLIVFTAASLALGYIFQETVKKRVILFVSAIALAVFLNTVRLVITAFLADFLELDAVSALIHDTTGMVMMIVGLVLLFGLNDLLKKAR